MKRKRLILFFALLGGTWFINVSRPGSSVEGCLTGCSQTFLQNDGELRVITFNMLHGFPKFEYLPQRLDLIASEIVQLDADIVLLQEVPWTIKTGHAAKYLAEKTGMNYAYLRANGNRWAIFFEEGEAILSRYPLTNPEFTELQPGAGFFEHRVALRAIAVTSMGEIDLTVTHLTHGEPEINTDQSQALLAFVEDASLEHTLIAGDFNTRPESPQIQRLSQQWIDAFSLIHPEIEGYTCCINDLTHKDAIPGKRIDYFLISSQMPEFNLVEIETVFDHPFSVGDGWLWASDHIGLMLTINSP